MRLPIWTWANFLRNLRFARKQIPRQAARRLHLETLEERTVFSTYMLYLGQNCPGNSSSTCPCTCSPVQTTDGDAAVVNANMVSYNSSSDPVAVMMFEVVGAAEIVDSEYVEVDLTVGTQATQSIYYAGGSSAEGAYAGDAILVGFQIDTSGMTSGAYSWHAETHEWAMEDGVLTDLTTFDTNYADYHLSNGANNALQIVNRGTGGFGGHTTTNFGDGWSLPQMDQLNIQNDIDGQPDGVALVTGTNNVIWYDSSSTTTEGDYTTYTPSANPYSDSKLVENDIDGTYQLQDLDGTLHNFDADGVLQSVIDRNGNVLDTYHYNDDNQLDWITDAVGRTTKFDYNDDGEVSAITDYCTLTGSPLEATPTSGVSQTTDYYYTDGLLTSMVQPDPDGSGPLASPVTHYGYDANDRLTSVIDPRGLETDISYETNTGLVHQITQRCGGTITITTVESQAVVDLSTIGNSTDNLAPVLPFAQNYDLDPGEDSYAVYETQNIYGNIFDIVRNQFGEITAEESEADGTINTYAYSDAGLLESATPPPVLDYPTAGELTTDYGFDAPGLPNAVIYPSDLRGQYFTTIHHHFTIKRMRTRKVCITHPSPLARLPMVMVNAAVC